MERDYRENANWTKSQIDRLARQLGIPYKKVYKWNWERKKKELSLQDNSAAQ